MFQENIGLAYHWAKRYKANPEMTQDALFYLWIASQKYNPSIHKMAFSTYANYWMLNAIPKRKKPEFTPPPPTHSISIEDKLLLGQLVQRLPLANRKIILLFLQGYSFQEISQLTSQSLSQAYKQYQQAIRQMKAVSKSHDRN